MNKRRWTLWIAAISLAGCLALSDAYWRWHDAGVRTRDALLSAMPPDASAVLFADLAELRRAPFATQFFNWLSKSPADAEDAQFLGATGVYYARDLCGIVTVIIQHMD